MWARPGAYHKVELQKGGSLGSAPALPTNIGLITSLTSKNLDKARKAYKGQKQKIVNYWCKKFCNFGPRKSKPGRTPY